MSHTAATSEDRDARDLGNVIQAVHQVLEPMGEMKTVLLGHPYIAGLLTKDGAKISITINLTD